MRHDLLGTCVKCGSAPKLQKSRNWSTFRVVCSRCGLKTIEFKTKEAAIMAWNNMVKRRLK